MHQIVCLQPPILARHLITSFRNVPATYTQLTGPSAPQAPFDDQFAKHEPAAAKDLFASFCSDSKAIGF